MYRYIGCLLIVVAIGFGLSVLPLLTIPPLESGCPAVEIHDQISGDGLGTGFVIADGFVLTAHHVTEVGGPLFVYANGLMRPAELVATTSAVRLGQSPAVMEIGDFALLRVNTTGLAPSRRAKYVPLRGAHYRWYRFNCREALGGTLVDSRSTFLTVFRPSTIPGMPIVLLRGGNFLFFDGDAFLGASGSPILNDQGELVGMVDLLVITPGDPGKGACVGISFDHPPEFFETLERLTSQAQK